MSHVVLLGDSIFDNTAYVPGGPSVIEHLRRWLPPGWRATLLARDGSVTVGVSDQADKLPTDATHLVVSVGGNDALWNSGVLQGPAGSAVEVLSGLADVREQFQRDYQDMLRHILGRGLPTAVCTVYDAIPGLGRIEVTGLCLFNDVILRVAFRAGVPVIDLRHVCNEASDYAAVSPIEPSAIGGGKIARAVGRLVTEYDFTSVGSRVFI
jgi:hypothetical protein